MENSYAHNTERLLAWYDAHRRTLPWRTQPGEFPDPYRIWVSEIMLQQTRAAAVIPYFNEFMSRWPTLEALALAPRNEILHAWAGLGYYARARNLHSSAQVLVKQYGGKIPCEVNELRSLPGVGPYTASAIAAIAFDQPTVVIDANVERILARLFKIQKPIPNAKPQLAQFAQRIFPTERPGDFAQALMDLGAQICTPKKPICADCPWSAQCGAYQSGNAEKWPIKRPKPTIKTRFGIVFWVRHPNGKVLLRKRPDEGILGGMTEVISSEWLTQPIPSTKIRKYAPIPKAHWVPIEKKIRHAFTHFKLELSVYKTKSTIRPKGSFWCSPEELVHQPLPTLMKKVVRLISSEPIKGKHLTRFGRN